MYISYFLVLFYLCTALLEESRTDSPNRKLSAQVQQASPTALPEKSFGTSNQEVMKKVRDWCIQALSLKAVKSINAGTVVVFFCSATKP